MSIYGPYEQILSNILSLTTDRIKELNQQTVQDKQPKLYEHLIAREDFREYGGKMPTKRLSGLY